MEKELERVEACGIALCHQVVLKGAEEVHSKLKRRR